jgi:hypothetical protein
MTVALHHENHAFRQIQPKLLVFFFGQAVKKVSFSTAIASNANGGTVFASCKEKYGGAVVSMELRTHNTPIEWLNFAEQIVNVFPPSPPSSLLLLLSKTEHSLRVFAFLFSPRTLLPPPTCLTLFPSDGTPP